MDADMPREYHENLKESEQQDEAIVKQMDHIDIDNENATSTYSSKAYHHPSRLAISRKAEGLALLNTVVALDHWTREQRRGQQSWFRRLQTIAAWTIIMGNPI